MNKGFLSLTLNTDLKKKFMESLQSAIEWIKQIETQIDFPILFNDFVRKKTIKLDSINDFHVLAYHENMYIIKAMNTQQYAFITFCEYPLVKIVDDLARMIFILFDCLSKYNFAIDKNYYEPAVIETIFNSIKELNERKEELENESKKS